MVRIPLFHFTIRVSGEKKRATVGHKKKSFLKKKLAFPPVVCKLSLTRQQPTKRKVENTMQAGKITAKLRDAVPVCPMVNGEEVMRYKNIELTEYFRKQKRNR